MSSYSQMKHTVCWLTDSFQPRIVSACVPYKRCTAVLVVTVVVKQVSLPGTYPVSLPVLSRSIP